MAAMPATMLRSSSDFPAPVVPAMRAWGPSATRSSSRGPSPHMPMGAARLGTFPAAFHRLASVAAVTSPPRRSTSATPAGQVGTDIGHLGVFQRGEGPAATAGQLLGHARHEDGLDRQVEGRLPVAGRAVGAVELDDARRQGGELVGGGRQHQATRPDALTGQHVAGRGSSAPRGGRGRRPPRG